MIALLTAAALHCAAVTGAGPLLQPRRMLFIGEMHGSREIPPLVGALACLARQKRVPVVVALEIPVEEAARLDAWMSSSAPLPELLRGEFWTRAYQDGRSSAAMAALIEELRRLGLSVVPYDPHPPDGKVRDAQMADRLAELRTRKPESLLIVLSGNLHNRVTVGVPWDAAYQPMGWHLAQRKIALRSLEVTYGPGATWMCEGAEATSCGLRKLAGKDQGAAPVVRMGHELPHVDGTLYAGALSASPPAISKLSW